MHGHLNVKCWPLYCRKQCAGVTEQCQTKVMCTTLLTGRPVRWKPDIMEMKIHKLWLWLVGSALRDAWLMAISKTLTNIKITNIGNNLRTVRKLKWFKQIAKCQIQNFKLNWEAKHLDALNDWKWVSSCKARKRQIWLHGADSELQIRRKLEETEPVASGLTPIRRGETSHETKKCLY